MTFQEFCNSETRKKLQEVLQVKNINSVPKLKKVVVNIGVGEAVTNKKVLEDVVAELALISGQKPVITKARVSISAFKIRKGMPIGVKVTLRGKKMYFFLEKLVKIVLPRIRDFGGINPRSVDASGNLNLGISEQTLFPEIDYDKISKSRGLQVTAVLDSADRHAGMKYWELIGIPFIKGE